MSTNKPKQFIKRKRQSRPKTLIFFGLIFIFLPVVSYFYLAYEIQVNFRSPLILFSRLNLLEIILLLFPLPVGVGLFSTKKWGWWLFMGYGMSLVFYNLYVLVVSPDLINIFVALQSILGIATVYYFAQKDISAPYMKMYPRGWRMQKRNPIEISVVVGGFTLNTRDVSETGIYINLPDCNLSINQSVTVIIPTSEGDLQIEAGVVRVDENGAGIAFRNLDKKTKKVLQNMCSNHEKGNRVMQKA